MSFGQEDINALGNSQITESLAQASITIKELNDQFGMLNDSMMKLVRINASIANNQGLQSFEKVSKELNTSKTNDSLKKFGQNLTMMASAQILESLGLMSGLSAILEAIFSPLSLVSPLLQVVAAIMQEAFAPTLIEMTPYIQMAAQFLIQHKDSIEAFIKVTSPFIIIMSLVTGNVKDLDNAFKAIGINFGELQKGMNDFLTFITSIPTQIMNIGQQLFSDIKGWRDGMGKAIDYIFENLVDDITGWGDDILDAIREALGL